MEGVLEEIGWIDEVKVSIDSGLVVDGHMRASLAISRGETVPVCYLKLTPEEERLALATYNPIAALAVPDEEALNRVLGQIETPNPDIATFLDSLYSEANQTALKAAQEKAEDAGAELREKSKSAPIIRMLMQVPEVQLLEQAIVRTGAATRGEAVAEICRAYLERSSRG